MRPGQELTPRQLRRQCDDDVAALARVPYVAEQLAALDQGALAAALLEYGAWNSAQLLDHQENLQRVLWIACCDIREADVLGDFDA